MAKSHVVASRAVARRTRTSQAPHRTAKRIEAFLRSDPAAPLTVAVGFASVQGLAWLAERTTGRAVTLVIGDCRRRNFAKADSKDRRIVRDFLARGDVEVKNWYRRRPQPAEAHLKVWIVHTKEAPRVLVGSANLTGAGLFHNWEMVTEAAPADLSRITGAVGALVEQAWDVKATLAQHIRSAEGDTAQRKPAPRAGKAPVRAARQSGRRHRSKRASPRRAAPARESKKGCLWVLFGRG